MIKNDSIVFTGGFGEKRNGSGLPVDGNTVFQIGSVSKSFTATLMAMMVDDGLVNWDDPVKWYLPDFAMYDPWVTDNMEVRDLFLHRSVCLDRPAPTSPAWDMTGTISMPC